MLQSRTCAVSITPPDKYDSDGAKATTDSPSGEVDVPTTSEACSASTPVQACRNPVVSTMQDTTQPTGNVDALSDFPSLIDSSPTSQL